MRMCATMDTHIDSVKHCGACIHWRDALTGWCDYYSWPMDADDTEPCKAYEAIADSENYAPTMVNELIELERKLQNEGRSQNE